MTPGPIIYETIIFSSVTVVQSLFPDRHAVYDEGTIFLHVMLVLELQKDRLQKTCVYVSIEQPVTN